MSRDCPCGCGKTKYKTSKEAKMTLRAIRGAVKGRLCVYRCCEGFWHMGHAVGSNAASKFIGGRG